MHGPGLAIALMRKGSSGPKASDKYLEKQEQDDYKMAFADAASEVLRYMKSGNEAKFAEALKAAIEICSSGYSEESEDDEEY